ncbi:MAG: MBL fold metallo-hydrolase [Oscillospiraceae bacterium]
MSNTPCKVIPLPLPFETPMGTGYLCAALLVDGENRVLVDCGNPGFLPKLEEALAAEGFSPDDLTAVVITHHDGDHMGALAALLGRNPRIRVYSSAVQKPYIEGTKPNLRDKPGVEPTLVDETVEGGQILPWCGEGGTEILATEGHMPGHISLYIPALKTLVTGDATTAAKGVLAGPNPAFTLDMPTAMRSLEALLDYDIGTVICYHGGVCTGDIHGQLTDLLARYTQGEETLS